MASRAARQSAVQWSRIIAEFEKSGLSVEQFCSKRGYASSTFNRWRLRFSQQNNTRRTEADSGNHQTYFVEALPVESAVVTIIVSGTTRVECPVSLGIETIGRLARTVAADEPR